MKEIIVIDENNKIKNELPEEYKDIEVRFSRYYKYEFWYENDDMQIIMSGWEDDVYIAELFAEETVESLFREIPWSYFVILDKRKDGKEI
jgi:hypothetical protein|nr:MAG TPA: hypothetical protein [Caudoviricetes sp.]